jgi:integrase
MLNLSLPLPRRPAAGRKTTSAKLPLKLVHVWGMRIRLQVEMKAGDLALFDLTLDSKLRVCDLVALKVSDLVCTSGVRARMMILQRKTGRPVQFEMTEQTRRSLASWLTYKRLSHDDWLFPSSSKPTLKSLYQPWNA